MSILTVAMLQILPEGAAPEANLCKGEDACRRAREMGADIALFPEMWSVGYTLPPKGDAAALDTWRRSAISRESPFYRRFQNLACELDMAIALTYLEAWKTQPRNTVSIISRQGETVLTYAKVHTCDFDVEAALTPGDDFTVCALDTAAGPVRVGAMICFDREFPESARVLMLKGAEIILTPNACTLEQNRLAQFRTRSFENMVGMAMANYPAPRDNGHSTAMDGMAYRSDETSRDICLVEAGEEEGIVLAKFDLDALRAYRARESWGDAYRKPGRYAPLVWKTAQPPFERFDSRRN
ncbi:MAG: carbon-nitrogen hydrolase family protein [Anaerolineaceae bacterium]